MARGLNTCPLGTLCVTRLGVDFIRFHPLTVWSYRDRRVRYTASNRHYNLISTLFTCWYKWISVPPCPSEVAIKLRFPSPDGREAQRPSPDEEADGGDESSVRELRARRQADRSFPRLHLHRRTVSVLVPPGDLRDLHWSSSSVRRQDRLGEVGDGHRRRGGRDREATRPPDICGHPGTKPECFRGECVHGCVRARAACGKTVLRSPSLRPSSVGFYGSLCQVGSAPLPREQIINGFGKRFDEDIIAFPMIFVWRLGVGCEAIDHDPTNPAFWIRARSSLSRVSFLLGTGWTWLRSLARLRFFWRYRVLLQVLRQFISDLVAHGKEHKKECHKMVA